MKEVQFNIKIKKKDLDLIKKVSLKRGEGYSDFARLALKKELARLGFLTKSECKALEIDVK